MTTRKKRRNGKTMNIFNKNLAGYGEEVDVRNDSLVGSKLKELL